MSERERKSKGEPGRALPNLPKFLQGKPSPPAEKPSAPPPAPVIPPIEGAGPATKKPKPATSVPPQPKTAKPVTPPPNELASNQPKGGPSASSALPAEPKSEKRPAAPAPAANKSPAPESKQAAGTPPAEKQTARPTEKVRKTPETPATKTVIPPRTPAPSVAPPEPPAAEVPSVEASESRTVPPDVSGASHAGADNDPALDDVLPQAVSLAVVREAMAAEKAFRPLLFAGPLKRVAKAAHAEKNGSKAAESHAFSALPVSAAAPRTEEVADSPASPAVLRLASETAGETDKPRESFDAEPARETRSEEESPKTTENSKESERRKSKRRKAVSSVLLAAANRAKAASEADGQRDGGPSFADPWDRIRAAAIAPVEAEGPTIRAERDPEEEEITPDKIVRRTPPFLASLILHVVLFVALAMIVLPGFQSRTALELDMNYATEETELLEAISLDLPTEMDVETTDLFSTDLAEVADPLESAMQLPSELGTFEMTTPGNLGEPAIGFSGRDAGTKQALLTAFGGTIATEDAVKLGLGWMKRQQQKDGRWLLNGPYSNGASLENPAAATSMALLAFLGDGHTPTEGEFRQAMTKGADALLRFQDSDGNFYIGPDGQHRLYTQAQATIAVCELYGMTRDERFREAAELAVEYCVRSQAPEGGWRYYPGQESDTSVTGWFLMALKSAEMAGIDVPPASFDRISAYLDKVQDEEGWQYKYRIIERDYSKTMTAEAMLCRQYLGWQRDDLRMKKAVDYLLQSPIATDEREVYYWYYASQTLHHYGGEEWESWNANLREVLPAIQERNGREQGSWSPRDDEWGSVGGRLFMTSLCLYTLEIYYRHLPLYQQAGEATTSR